MPQMAPMSWVSLMMFFIMMLIIMMTLNYFIIQPSIPNMKQYMPKTNLMNWKW
uniref:ATP synthase complex subunit 8 n=1 Tax=Turanogryllus eous TaxID=2823019 RepID=A0A8A6W3R1_9ORTH|nr:ATP synthase F0 subunit 8 [Turanogryllus eous]QTK22271.1 ATP synthase F0 subunit 8 [Turanogryllus eous]